MKNKIAALCCMAVLAGCQQAEEMENMNEKLPLSIEASIGSQTESRYSSNDNTPDGLTFCKDDKIGVFMGDRAADEWTKQENGSWESTDDVYWPNKTNTQLQFYAFYPYTAASSTENVPMPSLANQNGTIESLSACDFLVAATKKAYTDNSGKVSFTGNTDCFKHVSSLVAITILKESDLGNSTIQKISFEGSNTNLGGTTTYSFTTGTITPSGSNEKMESSDLNVSMTNETNNKTFYFILNSGADLSAITFTIEYQTDNKNYTASKTGLGNSGSLAQGKRYNFNLNITDGVLQIDGCDIKDWEEGETLGDIIINTPQEKSNP